MSTNLKNCLYFPCFSATSSLHSSALSLQVSSHLKFPLLQNLLNRLSTFRNCSWRGPPRTAKWKAETTQEEKLEKNSVAAKDGNGQVDMRRMFQKLVCKGVTYRLRPLLKWISPQPPWCHVGRLALRSCNLLNSSYFKHLSHHISSISSILGSAQAVAAKVGHRAYHPNASDTSRHFRMATLGVGLKEAVGLEAEFSPFTCANLVHLRLKFVLSNE